MLRIDSPSGSEAEEDNEIDSEEEEDHEDYARRPPKKKTKVSDFFLEEAGKCR